MEWASANPVLAAGEPGVETDTHHMKVGDGSTAWNSLPYYTLDPTAVHLTGSETLSGTKNFTGSLQVNGLTVETTTGAQTKADAAQSSARAYTDSSTSTEATARNSAVSAEASARAAADAANLSAAAGRAVAMAIVF